MELIKLLILLLVGVYVTIYTTQFLYTKLVITMCPTLRGLVESADGKFVAKFYTIAVNKSI